MSAPYYADGTVTVHHGDCLDVLATLPDASVDAVVTDPPYGLGFMGKEWDSIKQEASRPPSADETDERFNNAYPRTGKGPAAVAFDGHAFQAWCLLWAAECLRVLKPGGHLLAFGGTRTSHRLTCAIEDAGFEIRDSIAWLYGSGFPKSLDVSKAIDKRPGVSRHAEFAAHLADRRVFSGLSCADVSERVVGTRSGACWNWEHHQFPEAKWWPALRDLLALNDAWGEVVAEAERAKIGERTTGIGTGRGSVAIMGDGNRDVTTSATDAARTWQGWGTALKPAHEPVVVARKPLAGTVAGNVLAWGVGGLNIDACRVEHGADVDLARQQVNFDRMGYQGTDAGTGGTATYNQAGRWPANVVLDEGQAAALDQQSGAARSSGIYNPSGERSDTGAGGSTDFPTPGRPGSMFDDSGGASRFFYVAREDDQPCANPAPANTAGTTTPPPSRHAGSAPGDAATSAPPVTSQQTPSASTNAKGNASGPSDATNTPPIPSTSRKSWREASPPNGSPSASHANSVEPNGPTDITTTTTSQSTSGGFAGHTTSSTTETLREPGGRALPLDELSSRFTYTAKADAAERVRIDGTAHPTVKPLALMRWLVRLVCPPGGIVLEPFAGSGTTVEACILEGFRCIAIEREADYLPLITQRIHRRRDPVAAVLATGEDGGLFDLLGEEPA